MDHFHINNERKLKRSHADMIRSENLAEMRDEDHILPKTFKRRKIIKESDSSASDDNSDNESLMKQIVPVGQDSGKAALPAEVVCSPQFQMHH